MKTSRFILLISFSFLITDMSAQNKKKRKTAGTYNTNIEAICQGVGSEGTQLFKVYFYFKKEKNAGLHAKENAVKVLLFQGVPTGKGCVNKGLVSQEEYDDNLRYFDLFFEEEGAYLMYVNLISDSMIERIKMSKKNYKAAWVVSVNYDNLRNKLIEDGIIKALNSGF